MFYHNANYNNICGNNISRISVEGIWLQDQVSSNIVAENIFLNCSVGIKLLGPNYYNVLSGNFLANGRCGILIQNAQYTEISNNTITHHYGDEWDAGIRLDQAGYSRIYSNLITDNWRGILLYTTSPHVSIYDNSLTYNEFAVRVASGGSNYLNVSYNVVMHNRGYGIGLTGFGGGSNYATISRNQIENNSDGIALGRYSNYNMLLQNNISQNSYGFYIDYSTQNTIWGNNIVDNDQQVYVSTGSVNNWNGSYPSGGNYWSDYAGVDIYRGQNQNLPGNDNLGDTPYIIDAVQLDNFPLMEPWTWAPNDIAVEEVTLSKNAVGKGYNLHANVTVTNQGIHSEAFNVTLYTNTTIIERREVVLSNGNSTTFTFTWNTSDITYGNYTIWAYAEPVPGEAYTVDNTYVTRIVTVTILGDVDGDRDVDIFDIVQIASIYGVHVPPPDPRYNPNCDIDENGYIEIFDILAAASNYDESW
jgi:parallel beta-helix repeat protein